MKVVPVGENLVVKRLTVEPTSQGGILLPETSREAPQEGRVLSVGDGKLLADGTRADHQVGEGDRVLFQRFSGNEVIVDGQTLLVMSESDILAIVK